MMTVTVYAKPGCPPCDATIRALDKSGIGYRKVDITTASSDELAQMPNYGSAPIVTVTGPDTGLGQHWSGFRPDRIDALVTT